MEQIFISYRRSGGDVTAKLICESLKNRGYTVFFDYDALKGGPFDKRLLSAIEGCKDFLLVLPEGGLDRCEDEEDWVRLEIAHALKHKKNIIPVMLPGFAFPKKLPDDIDAVRFYNGVRFLMDYYDAVIDKIVEKLSGRPVPPPPPRPDPHPLPIQGKLTLRRPSRFAACIRNFGITVDGKHMGTISNGGEVVLPLAEGIHQVCINFDWVKETTTVTISPTHPEAILSITLSVFNKPVIQTIL